MREDYRSVVTAETLKEMVDFIQWYNRVLGHEPLIVGGWAAWAYHQDLGSKDIDVVFPGAAAKQATLLDYFHSHGFKTRKDSLFDYEFYKERKTSDGRLIEVLVDAVSSERRVIVSGTKITIPWGLAEKHKRKFRFAKDAEAYIVAPELLLVYKIGALVGRDHNLRVSATDARAKHYRSKLWKDAHDVLGMFQNCRFDGNLLFSLVSDCGLGGSLDDAKRIAIRYLSEAELLVFEKIWSGLFSNRGKTGTGERIG